jgi:hypothetical protein
MVIEDAFTRHLDTRDLMESPAGGLAATAAVWALAWPWLSYRRRHAAAAV